MSKEQKICTVTKSKGTRASKKENLSDGNQARSLKRTKGPEMESSRNTKDVMECFFGTLKGDVAGESSWLLNSKENFSGRPVPLGGECYLTPDRDKAEEKSPCGMSEKQQKKNIDFATVTTAEFGITQESFTNGSRGKSPTALKFRRRSAIGVRGSPENNTLIRYLAQQRSNRQKEASAQQASPLTFARSLKNKIDVFQTSFMSAQEVEGRTGSSALSHVSDASQEAGCSQNKAPFTKQHSLDQHCGTFMADYSQTDLKENFKQNLTNGNKSDTKMCTILSLHQDVTEPAAVSKEWAYKHHNPIKYSEAALIRDILETSPGFGPAHISKEVRSNVVPDVSRRKVNFAEDLSLEIHDESRPPATPLQTRNSAFSEGTQGGSQLRSVLKKTPVRLVESVEEYSDDAVDRGGSESLRVSDHVKIFEALQTEKTEQDNSEKPKKKKVTFGEDLSPEIFDETLPANTPLRKGATPVRHPGSQSDSPFTRLIEEPLTQPNFDCNDECVEPLQELQEGSGAREELLPVENTEGAETDKSYITLRSSTKKKCSTISERIHCSVASAKNAKDTKSPRKSKPQRPKSVTSSAAKKTQKTKHAVSGKRRKKKVKKSLYGEREMASKKPLLSPIPEIPEVFSSVSSPDSPKAHALLPDNSASRSAHKDVQQEQVVKRMREKNSSAAQVCPSPMGPVAVEASNCSGTALWVSGGDLKPGSGIGHEFPNVVPDTSGVFDAYDCFQQAEETACLKNKTESDFLIENERLQGDFPNKEEWLTGLEFLEQDTGVHEVLQRTRCPPKSSSRGRPRRRSSTVYFPPIEKFNFETTGNELQVSSFNVEEVLSAPQLKNSSSEEPFRRKNGSSSGTSRVRRSMRLHRDAEMEGLAWIEVPNEILKNSPPLAAACKTRRTRSTSVLTESENIHCRGENLIRFAAPGKENKDSVNVADGPCKRQRKSICVPTAQETRTWSPTRKRSITNSAYRKDRRSQKHSEEVEIALENNTNT